MEDYKKSRIPCINTTDENVIKVKEIVCVDRCVFIHYIIDTLVISYNFIQAIIIVKLNMPRVATKFVTRLLPLDRKNRHVTICKDLCNYINVDHRFMRRIITKDVLVLWLCSGDKAAVVLIEATAITKSDKKTTRSTKLDKEHVNRLFSFISKELYIMYLFLLSKHWMQISIVTCYNDYAKIFVGRDRNCRVTISGSDTLTTLPHTPPS